MLEVGLPIIDLNPPPGHYALQQFKENPFKLGEEEMAERFGTDDIGWLFGQNPFKMGIEDDLGAILALTDENPQGLPPYNFAMGTNKPSTFALGLTAAKKFSFF